MTLPLTDSALIGSCLAASALGLLVLTSSGGSAPAPNTMAPSTNEASSAGAQQAPALPFAAAPMDAPVAVDAEFGDKVRAYLLQNPEVIFEAVAVFEQRNLEAQANMDSDLIAANAEALFNDPKSWVGGNPDGDITLVEFIDYRCGFCKRAYDEVASLLEQDGNIRLITKEFPVLGPESELASRFAISVLQLGGDAAYAQTKTIFYQHNGPITPDFLEDVAGELELDFADLSTRMGEDQITEILLMNRAVAQNLQITGTPTFVMETELIRGFVGAEVFVDIAESLRQD